MFRETHTRKYPRLIPLLCLICGICSVFDVFILAFAALILLIMASPINPVSTSTLFEYAIILINLLFAIMLSFVTSFGVYIYVLYIKHDTYILRFAYWTALIQLFLLIPTVFCYTFRFIIWRRIEMYTCPALLLSILYTLLMLIVLRNSPRPTR